MGFFDGIAGDFLSLAGGIASGLTGSSAQKREYERQKEFAQNGIRWRVADAKAAGLHPLAALGNAPSYSPQVAVGTDFGLTSMGQNISRAAEAKATQQEREELLELQKEEAKANINKTNAEASMYRSAVIESALKDIRNKQTQLPPPMPTSSPSRVGSKQIIAGQTESTAPLPGSVPTGSPAFSFHVSEEPELYYFLPNPDIAEVFEDKPLIEFAPFIEAGRVHAAGKTVQGMVYIPDRLRWTRKGSNEEKKYMQRLQDSLDKRLKKRHEIQYERR